MDKNGPIILIDDDDDDLQLFIEIFADMNLQNEVHLFKNTRSVITFLQKPEINPFMIISDINMPVMNGFQLREQLRRDPAINKKNIPYLFFSTTPGIQITARNTTQEFQGVFLKPDKKSDWRIVLDTIVKYWKLSLPPDETEFNG